MSQKVFKRSRSRGVNARIAVESNRLDRHYKHKVECMLAKRARYAKRKLQSMYGAGKLFDGYDYTAIYHNILTEIEY